MRTKLLERAEGVWCVHTEADDHLGALRYLGGAKWQVAYEDDKLEKFESPNVDTARAWLDDFFGTREMFECVNRKNGASKKELSGAHYGGFTDSVLTSLYSLSKVTDNVAEYGTELLKQLAYIISEQPDQHLRGLMVQAVHDGLDQAVANYAKAKKSNNMPAAVRHLMEQLSEATGGRFNAVEIVEDEPGRFIAVDASEVEDEPDVTPATAKKQRKQPPKAH